MPFQCSYCGGQFCSAHRLPENHACPKIELAHAQKQEAVAEIIAPKSNAYQYSFSYGQPLRRKGRVYIGQKEVKHLTVAILLVLGIGFSIAIYGNNFNGWGWTLPMMSVLAVLLTASFLIHEMAHKITAQRYGLWAEFRLVLWGAVVTLLSVFSPFLRMIAPGAMMIAGSANKNEVAKISIAGALTNLSLAVVLLCAGFIQTDFWPVFWLAGSFNAFMALFNLIPFGVLDGLKIFNWNKKVWALAFIPSVILTAISYMYLSF